MVSEFILKNSVEKLIMEEKLFIPLIQFSSDGLILCNRKNLKILMMNNNAKTLLDLCPHEEKEKLCDILESEKIDRLLTGETINLEIGGMPVEIHSAVMGTYIWLFIVDFTDVIRIENLSQKTLELNRELIGVFHEYGDDTLMVTDSKGNIEFAGEKISKTCGVASNYFVGKNVYDVEREGIFVPSVSVKVLETKQSQVVIQKTRIGEELVSVSAPVLNEDGEIEKVVSVTRDYSTQMKISKMIAELGESEAFDHILSEQAEDKIVTCNDTMFEIKTLVKMIAPTKATVLINGETGTGKEVIARYIYSLSDRKDQPFIKVNCGTISPSIVESELFGYEEGSFTGANKGGKIGLVEAANGGTLFLDEISELPIEQQVKLLHVLQEKMLIRVGGTQEIGLDIRVIAAANKDLEEQVSLGNFREDLYYRLNVIPIRIPPLRERKEDIPLLSKHFFKRFCAAYKKDMQLSNNAVSALEEYSWPGNIRQLENTIERLVLTTPKPTITADDLPEMFKSQENRKKVKISQITRLDQAIEEVEKELIKMALDEYGTTVKAAEALGVNQSTVSRKIAQYGLKEYLDRS
ncbi:sigma 54-interacting transcriptional regulator [Anaerovorax odorimutans]|uniref:HTH-type transcriptional regulatory protein TyrR n=1 Tax=Anaerovorax odorimutans TaxID=109327 RepID=A0ABT1RTL0_9FIRM|nr:sigma 54-interacting transcriptional regulator [Anaerovorax odorimutans]MCQ4638500.1 sigma 54-interacting transcriptional regulator [Anaerovorax odorimutans]